MYPLGQGDLDAEPKHVDLMPLAPSRMVVDNPSRDYCPPKFVNLLFTDLGVLTPAAVSDELIQLCVFTRTIPVLLSTSCTRLIYTGPMLSHTLSLQVLLKSTASRALWPSNYRALCTSFCPLVSSYVHCLLVHF